MRQNKNYGHAPIEDMPVLIIYITANCLCVVSIPKDIT